MARTLQLSLPAPRTWGGRRAGAGRKLTPGCRPSVPHRPRPTHTAAHPVHVTLRSGPAVRCLRSDRAFPAVRRALYVASRGNFRIIHFTVQDDHLHLIVEADDTRALSRGMRGLAIRVARAVNRALGRRGAVWGDRFHARALTTPRAVRNALVYVFDEPPQASRGRTRSGPLLVGAMVPRLAGASRHSARPAARRGRAHVACRRRVVQTWPPRARRTAAFR